MAQARPAWAGEELLVFGAQTPGVSPPPGTRVRARYRPADDAWYPMAPLPFAGPFSPPVQEWTGVELLVVGAA